MYTKIGFICLCIVAIAVDIVHSDDDFKKVIIGVAKECMKSISITEDEHALFKKKQLPESENARCFVACIFKTLGVMDEEGKISVETVKAQAEKFLADNPEKLKMANEFIENCKYVNDLDVKDGEKGCDRAAEAFKCATDLKSKLGVEFDD